MTRTLNIGPLDIPPYVAFQLEKVRMIYPSAVIAGGYLRDMIWGFPFKDIDIFVPDTCGIDVRDMARVLGATDFVQQAVGYCGASAEIVDASEFSVPGIGLVNVISASHDWEEAGESFADFIRRRVDFGACRLTYNGRTVTLDPEAVSDIATSTMTLLRTETVEGVERSLKRAERFKARMPGITFNLKAAEDFLLH